MSKGKKARYSIERNIGAMAVTWFDKIDGHQFRIELADIADELAAGGDLAGVEDWTM